VLTAWLGATDSRKDDELADSHDPMDIDIVQRGVSRLNPAINAVVSINEPLFAFVFGNDDRAVKMRPRRKTVTTR